jgi:hypothetical protein
MIGILTRRLAFLALSLVLVYATVIRPWHFRWGTTDDERRRPLPGDDLMPAPRYRCRRAITINAPPDQIWPWLLQLGQGRGGFYSYDWLENLIRLDIHSVDRIVPELQTLEVGDFIAAEPNQEFGWVVATLEAPRAMVLRVGSPRTGPAERGSYFDGGIAGVWSFVLDPMTDRTTRLIAGYRADWDPSVAATLFNALVIEPGHFIMERAMLRGIKQRAEDNPADRLHGRETSDSNMTPLDLPLVHQR